MDIIEFTNKVWIETKGRTITRVLNICGWIYVLCNIVLFIMEGISIENLIWTIAAIILIIYTRNELKIKGKYIVCDCKLTFAYNQLIWEYPQIDMQDGRGLAKIVYKMDAERINRVALSEELQSIRVECSPVVEYMNSKNKSDTLDFQKSRKKCILILYNYDIRVVEEKIKNYLNIPVHEVE